MVYAIMVIPECVLVSVYSAQALSRMGGLWRKSHTVWVNVGGLHAGVFVLRRTASLFGSTPEDVREPHVGCESQEVNMEENVQSARSE